MSELSPETVDRLVEAAAAARENAHAPYSGFAVGAAVLDANGRIHVGCNVENASFGLTQCAERNALAAAIAAGVPPGSIPELVVFATGFEVLSPCGACRQVMSELLAADAVVHCCNEQGETKTYALSQLFPERFVLE